MNPGVDAPLPPKGAVGLGFMLRALRSDPAKLRILYACTLAAVATVFEPQYLTLSTSVIQAGLRTPNSPAPLIFATAFLLLALVTVIAGTAADVFGRRFFLLAGLGGLTLSNILGLIWLHSPTFVIADLINAICGVLVLPAAIAIVTLTFEPMLRPIAYGILLGLQGTALVIAPFIIPMMGGAWDGRATFIPVVVIGIVASVMVVRHVPESSASKSLHRGSVVVNLIQIAGMFVLSFLLVTARIRSEQQVLVLSIIVALLLFAAVVRWLSQRLRYFEGIEVYSGRDLGFAIFSGIMLMFAQGCFFYQIVPYFDQVQKVSSLEFALRMAPYLVGLLAGGLLVARLALRFGARRILMFSFIMLGLAMLGLSQLKVDLPFWVMLVPITLIGLSGGLGGPARTTVVMSSPPEGLVNGAAAVNTAAGQAGYVLGVIISSVLVTQHADNLFITELTAAGVPADTVTQVSAALQNISARLIATIYPELPEAVTKLTGVSYANAFTSGMTQMFFVVAIWMFITALALYIGMRRGLRASFVVPPQETQ